jgi:hypothetical protein
MSDAAGSVTMPPRFMLLDVTILRETPAALLAQNERGDRAWIPKVLTGKRVDGSLEIEGWFVRKIGWL